jgi:hypothetical protein
MGTLTSLGCLWHIHFVVEQRFFGNPQKHIAFPWVFYQLHLNGHSTLASVFVVHAICIRTKVCIVDNIMCFVVHSAIK